MITSMTAFGRSQEKGEWGSAVWELRSVNHRYLDFTLRLPNVLRELESQLREIIHHYLQRGKIECILYFQPGPKLGSLFSVNNMLLQQLIDTSVEICQIHSKYARINVVELLAWNGVVSEDISNINSVHEIVINAFKNALADLMKARQREGKVLQEIILDRIQNIQNQVEKVQKYYPKLIDQQREKILSRFNEAKIQLDPLRLENEMVYLAQKMDVSEELDRMQAHIAEVRRILKKVDSTGRRLDFMMQELNREANTLASKSTDPEVTHAAVEMKVLIEQIREQVQNVE